MVAGRGATGVAERHGRIRSRPAAPSGGIVPRDAGGDAARGSLAARGGRVLADGARANRGGGRGARLARLSGPSLHIVAQQNGIILKGNDIITLDLSQQANGLYFVEVAAGLDKTADRTMRKITISR